MLFFIYINKIMSDYYQYNWQRPQFAMRTLCQLQGKGDKGTFTPWWDNRSVCFLANIHILFLLSLILIISLLLTILL